MVNSPSRPNSRPPAPVECGGMTPLWNWETCLPVDRPAMPASSSDMPLLRLAPPGVGTPRPHFPSATRNPGTVKVAVRKDQGKNPSNRASSRQIKAYAKIPMAPDIHSGIPHLRTSASICGKVPPPSRSPISEIRARIRPNQGKNPSNQGSSSLIKANAK